MRLDFDDLDRLLSSEELLRPSDGFTARVMDRVQEAAAEPPPLAFPWARVTVGVIACLVCSGLGATLIVNTEVVLAIAEPPGTAAPAIGYAAAAVLASLAARRLTRASMTRRRFAQLSPNPLERV